MTLENAQVPSPDRTPEVRSILLVEADPDRANELSGYLESEGYDVQLAADGPGALAACGKAAPALALIDAGLATADNAALMTRLGRTHPGMLLVLIAGPADIDAAIGALDYGAHHYLRKPPVRTELRALLRRCLDVRRLRRSATTGATGEGRGPVEGQSEQISTEALLADAVALANLGHFIRDVVANRFLYCSEEYARILGISLEKCLESRNRSQPEAGWVHPGDRKRYLEAAQDALRLCRPLDIEYRVLRADGEVRHVREREQLIETRSGVPLRSHGIVQDITELRQVEEAARSRDVWLRAILANSPMEIALKDLDGRILAISRNTLDDHGLSEEDVIGHRSEEFLAPELLSAYVDADRKVIETGEALQQEVTEMRNGRLEHFLNAKFPLTDDAGRIIGVCSLTSRTTPFKEVEARLNQAQRMETVGQLTGGVAHEFNNLLAVMMGNLELVEDQLSGEHTLLERVERALCAGRRGADLIARLLAFSRKQTLHPSAIDLNHVLEQLTGLLEQTLGPQIALELRPAEGLWLCSADLIQLKPVLLNLAINARDAMPEHGRVTLETANVALGSGGADLAAGDYIMLSVSDTGEGVAPEVMDRVFEPFFTTRGLGRHSGLGLSMVFGFAKQSGGHVTIESRLDEGTTVKLYLPRYRSTPAETEAAGFVEASALSAS